MTRLLPAKLTISAVIPTFNRSVLLERALGSVLGQSRPPDEVIVVDDGSRDDTRERLRSVPCVRALFQHNLGAAAARNRGTKAASGTWIAFLDDDDVWGPDHLERIEASIEATEGSAGFYFRDSERLEPGGLRWSQWGQAGLNAVDWIEFREDSTEWALLPAQPFMLQASVFRRELLFEIGGLDETLVRRHDTDLFLRLALGRSTCAVAGYGVTISPDDRSGQRLTERFDGRSRLYWDCTVRLYEKAILEHPKLEARHRKELERRLAAGHLALAKLAFNRRENWFAGSALGSALAHAPALIFGRLVSKGLSPFRRRV